MTGLPETPLNVEIRVADLRAAAEKLFRHLEESGIDVVEVPYDYYWFIPKETLADFRAEPSEFTVGQLSDDLAYIQGIGSSETEPVGYALKWLASLLRAVGEKVVA